jgi:hypothetical protein
MMRCKLFRKWSLPCVLVGLVVLAALAGLALRARSAESASAEVVSNHPIRVVQAASSARQAVLLPGTGQSGQARVHVPVDFFDFRRVDAQEVVRRDFLVINRGSVDLVISQAYTTCGCTTAELSASIIPPGKASRVTVIFDAGYHPIAEQASPITVRRGLVLETNDPNHRVVEIWVQASVGR